jgi:hypothetical protein
VHRLQPRWRVELESADLCVLCVLVQSSLLVGLLLPPFVPRKVQSRSRSVSPGATHSTSTHLLYLCATPVRRTAPYNPNPNPIRASPTHSPKPKPKPNPNQSDPLPLEPTRAWLCAGLERAHMRPSRAAALVRLAAPLPGEVVLDPCGGTAC